MNRVIMVRNELRLLICSAVRGDELTELPENRNGQKATRRRPGRSSLSRNRGATSNHSNPGLCDAGQRILLPS